MMVCGLIYKKIVLSVALFLTDRVNESKNKAIIFFVAVVISVLSLGKRQTDLLGRCADFGNKKAMLAWVFYSLK